MPDTPVTISASYDQLRSYESDFDRSQGAIRRAASVWVLAAFGALAYALSLATQPGAPLPAGFVGVLLSWAAALGLGMLWFIDQMVYQRLLHSVFVQGLFMEWRDPGLPPIRTKMFFDNRNVSGKLSWYYLAPILAFLGSHAYFSFSLEPFDSPELESGAAEAVLQIALVVSHLALARYVYRASRRKGALVADHGEPYPEAFTAYLDDRAQVRALLAARASAGLPD